MGSILNKLIDYFVVSMTGIWFRFKEFFKE